MTDSDVDRKAVFDRNLNYKITNYKNREERMMKTTVKTMIKKEYKPLREACGISKKEIDDAIEMVLNVMIKNSKTTENGFLISDVIKDAEDAVRKNKTISRVLIMLGINTIVHEMFGTMIEFADE